MATYDYSPGLGNAASYQVSGIPWVSGNIECSANGEQVLNLPSVSSWIMVANNDTTNPCRVGFSELGVKNTNYFTLLAHQNGGPNTLGPLDLKVTQVWVSGSTNVDIIVGLTSINIDNINNNSMSPSGSMNWSGSVAALVG